MVAVVMLVVVVVPLTVMSISVSCVPWLLSLMNTMTITLSPSSTWRHRQRVRGGRPRVVHPSLHPPPPRQIRATMGGMEVSTAMALMMTEQEAVEVVLVAVVVAVVRPPAPAAKPPRASDPLPPPPTKGPPPPRLPGPVRALVKPFYRLPVTLATTPHLVLLTTLRVTL